MITSSVINLVSAAWMGMAAASPPSTEPPAASVDCTARAEYRRLNDREIEAAIADNTIVYDWAEGMYRAIISERFHDRRGRYEVQYPRYTGGGAYTIARGLLCTQETGESERFCRRMFGSQACGFAFSEPDGERPRHRVRIVD